VKAMGCGPLVGAGGPVIGVGGRRHRHPARGWRWIFVAQVPLTLAAMALAAAVLPETDRTRDVKFDAAGAALLAALRHVVPLRRSTVVRNGDGRVRRCWPRFALAPILAVVFVGSNGGPRSRCYRGVSASAQLRVPDRRAGAPATSRTWAGFILAPSLLAHFFNYGEERIGWMVLTRPLAFSITAPIAGYIAVRVGERSARTCRSLRSWARWSPSPPWAGTPPTPW